MAATSTRRSRRAPRAPLSAPPAMPNGVDLAPVKRGPGRPRKHPLPNIGQAPMQPQALPPNPGPASADEARAVDAEHELDAQGAHLGAPVEPVGLDAKGLVELVAEVRSIALTTYAMMARAELEPGELESLCELAPSRRRSMEAFAPAALPWVNAHLPNSGGLGVGLFVATALFSCIDPMRAIKARVPKRDPNGPPAELAGDTAPTRPGETVVHAFHAVEPTPEPNPGKLPDAWPELGTTPPASPGT